MIETSADQPAPRGPVRILDAIGPFLAESERHRINWSKIDFSLLERDGRLCPERLARVNARFETYCMRIAADGATGIALDDLAHLYLYPGYPVPLLRKLETCREAYRHWFAVAKRAGLEVYLNTDILFYTRDTLKSVGTRTEAVNEFLREACETVLDGFPEIQGVFFRLGECDGHDVQGDFLSRLVLRTPAQTNACLKELLPVFEARGRQCILRTWTVGAYPVGDLIWNPRTLKRVLRGLEQSPALMLSMKFGESDFFRHLELNPMFFQTEVPKLVELQTRREYEGAGEFPCFVGYDYEKYLRELEEAPGLCGAHVWCQTGGWTCFRRLTYLEPAGIWNEINTYMTLRMLSERVCVEEAVADFVRERMPGTPVPELLELLRLSEEVIRELMYLDDFARQPIYFRRSRLPPQLMVYWDHVFINHGLRKVLRCFVKDADAKVRQSQAALRKIDRMRELAVICGLPADDLDFMRDTFGMLAAARAYCLLPFDPHRLEGLQELKRKYKQRWTHRYRYAVKLDFHPRRLPRSRVALLLRVFFRTERDYRRVDKIVTVWLLGKLYPLLRLGGRRFFTGFAGKQAMGIGSVFR